MTTEGKLGKCAEQVHDAGTSWPRYHRCSRNAILIEDGTPWCRQHAPSAKAKRDAETRARWEAESERARRPYEQVKAGAILAKYLRGLRGLDVMPALPPEVKEALAMFPEQAESRESAPPSKTPTANPFCREPQTCSGSCRREIACNE